MRTPLLKFLSVLFIVFLAVPFVSCGKRGKLEGGGQEQSEQPALSAAPDIIRAFTVRSEGADSYPGKKEMDEEELRQTADKLMDFALLNSFNAIFYQATSNGEAMYLSEVLPTTQSFQFSTGFLKKTDPLKILLEQAKEKSIAVYAVIEPYGAGKSSEKINAKSLAKKDAASYIMLGDNRYYRPDNAAVHTQAVNAAAELSAKYKTLAGVVLSNVDESEVSDYDNYYTFLAALSSDISEAVKNNSQKTMQTGVILSSKGTKTPNREVFIQDICKEIDLIVPVVYGSTEQRKTSEYAEQMQYFVEQVSNTSVDILPVLSLEESGQNHSQTMLVNNLLGLDGILADDYHMLAGNAASELDMIIPMMYIEGSILPDYRFDFPKEFRITRPLDGNRLRIDSSWDSYYITGTSDPSKPVFFEGEEVSRIGEHGLFGVLVDVEEGLNEYEFSQGEETTTVELYRPDPDEVTKIRAISTYVSKSSPATAAFQPYGPQAVGKGLPMIFQCTAPAGGTVTASLDGKKYELEPAKTAEDGTPVQYRKEVSIPAKDPDSIVSIGYVTYTLEYNGEISEAEAPGEVFSVGDNRTPLFRVESGIGTVLNPSMVNGDFMTTLKPGSVGEITGQTTNYFKTSFGGFIQKVETSIITDLNSATNTVSNTEYSFDDLTGDVSVILHGTVNPSFVVDDAADGNFTIRLFDTVGVANGTVIDDCRFFKSVSAQNSEDDTLTLTFHAGEEPYFGYNVLYEGTNTILRFYTKPQLSNIKGRPLSGLTIVLDPGHGAADTGALGVPGETGPMEKNVNLYISQVTQKFLEGLGADVLLTRETDEDFLELYDRVRFTEQAGADLFIAMHHNSLSETINPEKVEGLWTFYYNDISQGFAEKLFNQISEATGRKPMGVEDGFYVFLRNTLSPSILLELGFMANAKEYEQICNEDNMLDVAQAVCEGIVDYISEINQ